MTYAEWRAATTLPRLMAKVQKQEGGCWIWTGFITPQGYGACGYRGKRNTLAHRAIYLELVGPIPDGLTLDHLCHTRDLACLGGVSCPHRRCVNPEHMEPVSNAENNSRGVFARKTHCPRGHPYSGPNLNYTKHGSRICRTCANMKSLEQHKRKMAARPDSWRPKPRKRPTHCKWGHPFDAANTYVRPNGRHACKTCGLDRKVAYRERMRGAA